VTIAYVADYAKTNGQAGSSQVDAGFIGQNVYLFCASESLATVFRGAVDYEKLNHTMQLGADQFVTFAQTVGYPRG